MQYIIIFILLLLIGAAAAYFLASSPNKETRLRNRYICLSSQPPNIAQETLNEEIKRLRKKHPGRGINWYLEKIIYDMQKDR